MICCTITWCWHALVLILNWMHDRQPQSMLNSKSLVCTSRSFNMTSQYQTSNSTASLQMQVSTKDLWSSVCNSPMWVPEFRIGLLLTLACITALVKKKLWIKLGVMSRVVNLHEAALCGGTMPSCPSFSQGYSWSNVCPLLKVKVSKFHIK